MRRNSPPIFVLAMLALLAASPAAVSLHAQEKSLAAVRADRRNVIDSQIPLGFDFPPIAGKAFRSATIIPLHKGMVLPSRGIIGSLGMDRMLSLRQHEFRIGSGSLRMPVISMLRCSNFPDTGEFVMVIASTIRVNAKLVDGASLQERGFRLQARRGFRAGETIPAARIIFHRKKFLFSLAGTPGASSQPLLSVAQSGLSAADYAIALEAWRFSKQSAQLGVPR